MSDDALSSRRYRRGVFQSTLCCGAVWLVAVGLATASAGAEQGVDLPDILVVAVDTLRADHLGCYGYARETSAGIDGLASEGVLFERCFSPASWTLPAFASIFTGLLPSAHGVTAVDDSGICSATPVITESLRRHGYVCAGVISNAALSGSYGFTRGFNLYDDYSYEYGFKIGSFGGHGGDSTMAVTGWGVLGRARQLFDQAKQRNRPVFLFAHFMDPHDSYIPPATFRGSFLPADPDVHTGCDLNSQRRDAHSAEVIAQLMACYDGEIAFTDSLVEQLCRYIRARSENLLILLIADHGEAFDEHGFLLHGNSVHVEETHVPMLWVWKGVISPGRRVKTPVSTLDIAPTLKELLADSSPDLMQGVSLWDVLRGGPGDPRRTVVSEKACQVNTPNQQAALWDDRHAYLMQYAPAMESAVIAQHLYDMADDPAQVRDVLASQAHTGRTMRESLIGILEESREIFEYYRELSVQNVPGGLSEEELQRLRSMGYLK